MHAKIQTHQLHPLVHGPLGPVLIVGLWFAAAALHPFMNGVKTYQPAFTISDATQEAVNSTPFATILGEVRASAADLMWIKTERYLHRGVAYAPHVDEGEMARSGQAVARPVSAEAPVSVGSQALEALHHTQEGVTSLVPDAPHDYRGFVGTLQREVQPWMPPGSEDRHAGGDELLPWYRLLTYSNPHHWRGYMIGTWWLMQEAAHEQKALDEAAQFIAEGIRNNPNIFQLSLMQGRLRMSQENWKGALDSFEQAVQTGLKLRTADGSPNPPIWTEDDEEDFHAAVRYGPLVYVRKMNDPARARDALQRALRLIPNDLPLKDLAAQLSSPMK